MAGLAHLGFGFAAKRFAPKVPLAALLAASEAIEILYVVFFLAGLGGDRAGYLSHGLFMSVVWTLLAAGAAFIFSRSARTAAIVGLVAFAHWVLDFIVQPMTAIFPDATGMNVLFEGSPRVGLGLYRWIAAVVIGESTLLLGGILIYVFALRKIGREKSAAIEAAR